MSQYRVEATVGSYNLSSNSGDPASYGLIDPCVIQQSLPNADLAPLVQCNPDEATVTVLAPDPFTYSFSLGDQVRVTMYAAWAGGQNVAFFGRIAQLQAQPHKLGVLYTLQCVDYLADLAELKAGRVDYPLESSLTRVNRMLAENGIGPVLVEGTIGSGGFNDPNVAARVAATDGQVELMEALELVLAGWPQNFGVDEVGVATVNTTVSRYELRPNIVNPGGVAGQGSLDPVQPFKLSPIYRPQGWLPPARLGATPGAKLSVVPADTSPTTEALVLDAGHVEYNPVFTQQKGNAVQRVVVAFAGGFYSTADWLGMGYYQWRADSSTVEATVKCSQSVSTPVASSMYRGSIQPDASLQWTVGELLWRASRTENTGFQLLKLRRVVTVGRVDAANATARNPTGRTWVTGVTDTIRTIVQDGELSVAFTLGPMHYTKSGALSGPPHQALLSQWLPTLRRNLQPAPQADATGGYNASNAWAPAPTPTYSATLGPVANGPYKRFTSTGTNVPAASSVIVLQQHALPGLTATGSRRVIPGEQLTLSIYVRCSIAQKVFLQAVLEDAAGGGSAGSVAGATATLVANTWTRLTVTVTVPAGVDATDAAAVRMDLRAGAAALAWAVGTTFDIGAAQIERGAAASAYFDGATAAGAGTSYAWEGTANNSASVEQQTGLLISDLDTRDTFGDYLLMYG